MLVITVTLLGKRWRAEGGINRRMMISWLAGLILIVVASAGQADVAPANPKVRLAKAEAIFAERCKKSGEFIRRTVENVEGVFLMKIRPKEQFDTEQFALYDPYGNDSGGDRYIRSFLIGRRTNGSLTDKPDEMVFRGYRYVEAVDPADGKRYRFTGRIDQPWLRDKRYGEWVRDFVLNKNSAPGAQPRYGVTYDDISTHEEREYWIAGSSLRVIDLKTNEVIAERIGYLMDRGQGSRAGSRSPWLLAASNACPSFFPKGQRASVPGTVYQNGQTRNFVEKVLKPKGTE